MTAPTQSIVPDNIDRAATLAHYQAQVAELVLERLPNGEHAWLRPSTESYEAEDALFYVTDAGRRAVAMAALFGPAPTVAETMRRLAAA